MSKIEKFIPVRLCEYEVNDKIVTVVYDKFEKTWVDKLLKTKKEKTAKIDFDETGSFVWLCCNGQSDVQSIIESTEKKFDKSGSIKERVILFLNQLENRKFIRYFERKKV